MVVRVRTETVKHPRTQDKGAATVTPVRLLSLFSLAIIVLFLLNDSVNAESSNPQYAQWKGAGGQRLLVGQHKFTETWVSDNASRAEGKYWRDNFYLAFDKRKYAPWENTVKNSVCPRKGQITLQGPGLVVVYQRQKHAGVGLVNVKTKKGFTPKTCSISYDGKTWQGTIKPIVPAREFWGRIPAGDPVCLDVYASMKAYNNMVNTGEFTYRAPQELAFEVWYFPFEGGKVVEVVKSDPQEPKADLKDDPIIVDPKNIRGPVADSHVYAYAWKNWNKSNWGAYKVLNAGWNPTGGEKRTYLRFDLAGITPQQATQVRLRLYHYATADGPTQKLGVYRVLGKWIEGRGDYPGKPNDLARPGEITWVNQPPCEKNPMATFSPGAKANKFVEVDVTELVKSWLAGKPNHGMMIKAIGPLGRATPASTYGFYAREHEEAPKRPALVFGDGPVIGNNTGAGTGTGTGTDTGTGTGTDAGAGAGTGTSTSSLQVRVDKRQARQDTQVTVPVWLEFPKSGGGQADVANINIEITYNPAIVKPSAKVIAGNLMTGALYQANTAKEGLIKIGFARKQGVKTAGTLAQIPFQVVGQPGRRSPLNVTVTTANSSDNKKPVVSAVHGYIEILKAGVAGDYNGNGVVDAGDALAALKMSVDLLKEDLILNVDKQNGVTSNDARLLLKMAVRDNVPKPGTTGSTVRTGGTDTSPMVQDPNNVSAKTAYQQYIAAYNRLTALMAAGKGNTPEAKNAYNAYVEAKRRYEASIKGRPAPKQE